MNESQSSMASPAEFEPRPVSGESGGFWRWFWLTFLVVSLAYAWYCFYVPSNNVAWAGSYAAAQQRAAQTGKPMILFFTAEWCVPCRIMKRSVWADPRVTAAVNAAFVPVAIDVNDPGVAATLSRYGVGATPNTVITDSQGNVLRQREGGVSKSDFLEWLEARDPPAAENL